MVYLLFPFLLAGCFQSAAQEEPSLRRQSAAYLSQSQTLLLRFRVDRNPQSRVAIDLKPQAVKLAPGEEIIPEIKLTNLKDDPLKLRLNIHCEPERSCQHFLDVDLPADNTVGFKVEPSGQIVLKPNIQVIEELDHDEGLFEAGTALDYLTLTFSADSF